MTADWLKTFQTSGSQIPLWTQGAGGNFSIKQDNTLWIKTTGLRLDQVQSNDQLARIDLEYFRKNYPVSSEQHYADLIKTSADRAQSQNRPSMETGFHAILPKKYVFHFHSIVAVLASHLQISPSHGALIPWVKPGNDLTTLLSNQIHADYFFLKNHGVVLQSDHLDILDQFREYEISFCRSHGYAKLVPLLQSKKPLQDCMDYIRGLGDPLKTLKIYFPDTAVFVREVQEEIIRSNSQQPPQNKNAHEIWLATQILHSLCPDLPEVPEEDVERIANLPTEKIRLKNLKGSSSP